MEPESLKYQYRIVAFLDVLGFKSMLYEFEKEALEKGKEDDKKLVSPKATNFVNVFKEVTDLMDEFDCNYYLFSDNICLTVDPHHNKSLIVDILFTISNLFRKFSQMGFFLRGGIDYGLMLDEKSIAMGVPLANAYIMESEKAVFPRIIMSDKFIQFIENKNLDEHDRFNIQNFIKKSSEINYINLFYNVIKTDDKVTFFEQYKRVIEDHLSINAGKENIFMKYTWIAKEYNDFLSYYVENIDYFEQDLEITGEEIIKLKSLKI